MPKARLTITTHTNGNNQQVILNVITPNVQFGFDPNVGIKFIPQAIDWLTNNMQFLPNSIDIKFDSSGVLILDIGLDNAGHSQIILECTLTPSTKVNFAVGNDYFDQDGATAPPTQRHTLNIVLF